MSSELDIFLQSGSISEIPLRQSHVIYCGKWASSSLSKYNRKNLKFNLSFQHSSSDENKPILTGEIPHGFSSVCRFKKDIFFTLETLISEDNVRRPLYSLSMNGDVFFTSIGAKTKQNSSVSKSERKLPSLIFNREVIYDIDIDKAYAKLQTYVIEMYGKKDENIDSGSFDKEAFSWLSSIHGRDAFDVFGIYRPEVIKMASSNHIPKLILSADYFYSSTGIVKRRSMTEETQSSKSIDFLKIPYIDWMKYFKINIDDSDYLESIYPINFEWLLESIAHYTFTGVSPTIANEGSVILFTKGEEIMDLSTAIDTSDIFSHPEYTDYLNKLKLCIDPMTSDSEIILTKISQYFAETFVKKDNTLSIPKWISKDPLKKLDKFIKHVSTRKKTIPLLNVNPLTVSIFAILCNLHEHLSNKNAHIFKHFLKILLSKWTTEHYVDLRDINALQNEIIGEPDSDLEVTRALEHSDTINNELLSEKFQNILQSVEPCVNCFENSFDDKVDSALILCLDCQEALCLNCFNSFHSKGRRRWHKKITGDPCIYCHSRIGRLQCVFTNAIFCAYCFASSHIYNLSLEQRNFVPEKVDFSGALLEMENFMREKEEDQKKIKDDYICFLNSEGVAYYFDFETGKFKNL